MKKLLLATTLLALPAIASAQTSGCNEPAIMHGRLAVAPYKPYTLYECILSPDLATSIVAAGNEKVGPTGGADPAGLDIRRSENALFVQPAPSEINRSPNITFITKNTDTGQTRTYAFLFHVAGYGGVASIQLTYPEDEIKAKRELAAQAQAYPTRETPQVASIMRTAPFHSIQPGGMNWKYSCMCDSWPRGRPDISDNGQNTIVSFKGSTPTDIVISRLDRDGTEKPGELPHRATVVNFTPLSTGGSFVIPEVAEYWRVLSGNEVAAWRNDNYHPELVDIRTGTQSPAVVRVVKPTLPPKLQLPGQKAAALATPTTTAAK